MTEHPAGSIVAWTYRGAVQVGAVEGVQRGPDRAVGVYWCRPLATRLTRLVGRSPEEVTLVATYDQLVEAAGRYVAEEALR